MSLTETIIVIVVVVCATVAAILNHLSPELGLVLGAAIGYGGGKGIEVLSSKGNETPWKGAG